MESPQEKQREHGCRRAVGTQAEQPAFLPCLPLPSPASEVSAAVITVSAARQASPFPAFVSGHPNVRYSSLQMRSLDSWKSFWI